MVGLLLLSLVFTVAIAIVLWTDRGYHNHPLPSYMTQICKCGHSMIEHDEFGRCRVFMVALDHGQDRNVWSLVNCECVPTEQPVFVPAEFVEQYGRSHAA